MIRTFRRQFAFRACARAVLTWAGFCLWSSGASAAEFQIDYIDDAGRGFYDETPVEPIGANPGTTLGEQRRNAFEFAIQIWEETLSSTVPIKVVASFDPAVELLCVANAAALGAATSDSTYADFDGALLPDTFYPSPLADKLAGQDLEPGSPDIHATFNPDVDGDECLGNLHWNYSLTAGEGEMQFVNTALHEMAHGLGFATLVDVESGVASGMSPFERLTYDLELGLHWDEMTSVQRALSATKPFGLAWDGKNVTAAAPLVLAQGRPYVAVGNAEPIELVGEAVFGPRVTDAPVAGALVPLTPAEGCTGGGSLSGAIVMLSTGDDCTNMITQIQTAQARGAIGAVTRAELDSSPPWSVDAMLSGIKIPSLALTHEDFDSIYERAQGEELSVTLDTLPGLVGADEQGRVLLSANDPILVGTSVVHWDRSVRRIQPTPDAPDVLLMEPFDNGLTDNTVQDLTAQMLQDLGWGEYGCGNGVIEPGEECDNGDDNNSGTIGECRTDCTQARCGDGVIDPGELCDDGNTLDGDDCDKHCGFVQLTEGDASALLPDEASSDDAPDAGPAATSEPSDHEAPRRDAALTDPAALADAGAREQSRKGGDAGASAVSGERNPAKQGCGCGVIGEQRNAPQAPTWAWLIGLGAFAVFRRRDGRRLPFA